MGLQNDEYLMNSMRLALLYYSFASAERVDI